MNHFDNRKILIRIGDDVIIDKKFVVDELPISTIGLVVGFTEHKVIVETNKIKNEYESFILEKI